MAEDRKFLVTLLVYLSDELVEDHYDGDPYAAAVGEAVEQWNVEDVQEVEIPATSMRCRCTDIGMVFEEVHHCGDQ